MNRGLPLIVTVAAMVVMVLIDLVLGKTSPLPGYSASIGLFGCIAIIVVSKWLGKVSLQRREDHYPSDEPQDMHEDLRG